MKILHGDLIAFALNGSFDVIIHGCNCYCSMEAGVAKAIQAEFPEAFEADCKTTPGDASKLGSVSVATVSRPAGDVTIVNGYTQVEYGGSGVLVDYEAVRSVMAFVAQNFSGKRIGYPRIGAGLARGDWKIISSIIDEELDGQNHTLVEYQADLKK